jgi:hypothetical protein
LREEICVELVRVALFLPVPPDLINEAMMQEKLGSRCRVYNAHCAIDTAMNRIVELDSQHLFEIEEVCGVGI